MFKFKFSTDDLEEDLQEDSRTYNNLQWLEAREILPTDNIVDYKTDDTESVHSFSYGNFKIFHLSSDVIEKLIITAVKDISTTDTEMLHSDLIPAVYEGGYKIWECTYDLVGYILSHPENLFDGKKVLDVGCGAGILGICAAMGGAEVHFQDYNASVIEQVTIPNVYLNAKNCEKMKGNRLNYRYFCGDWESFLNLTERELNNERAKYDYILTSETIYNSNNHNKLYSIFKQRLKKSGTVYLAAKSHYFGVGGSTKQFEDLLRKDRVMKSTVCWKCPKGVQREILQIRFSDNE